MELASEKLKSYATPDWNHTTGRLLRFAFLPWYLRQKRPVLTSFLIRALHLGRMGYIEMTQRTVKQHQGLISEKTHINLKSLPLMSYSPEIPELICRIHCCRAHELLENSKNSNFPSIVLSLSTEARGDYSSLLHPTFQFVVFFVLYHSTEWLLQISSYPPSQCFVFIPGC